MKRVLAALVAAAMVAGSLYLRDRLDERAAAGEPGPGGTPVAEDGGAIRLVCATELRAACEALPDVELTFEDAGVTADRLVAATSADAGMDAWVVTAPWPEIVEDARQRATRAPLLGAATDPVARSPLVLAVWEDRATALEGFCEGSVTWRCLGEAAPQRWSDVGGEDRWGRVKPAHAAADTSATGLLVTGQAASGFFGRTDFTLQDLRTAEFTAWFSGLEQAVPTFERPLETMLQRGAAAVDAVGATEAEVLPRVERLGAGRARPLILYPEPVMTADVVVAPVAGSGDQRVEAIVEPLAGALAEAGWRTPGAGQDAAPSDAPTLPEANGLPAAGPLDALRATWREVAG